MEGMSVSTHRGTTGEDAAGLHALERLRGSLTSLRAGRLSPAALVAAFRAENDLLVALPAAFAQVMENTLQRLESSGLFAEESCSFSQQGLLENLDVWIQKAEKRLSDR